MNEEEIKDEKRRHLVERLIKGFLKDYKDKVLDVIIEKDWEKGYITFNKLTTLSELEQIHKKLRDVDAIVLEKSFEPMTQSMLVDFKIKYLY